MAPIIYLLQYLNLVLCLSLLLPEWKVDVIGCQTRDLMSLDAGTFNLLNNRIYAKNNWKSGFTQWIIAQTLNDTFPLTVYANYNPSSVYIFCFLVSNQLHVGHRSENFVLVCFSLLTSQHRSYWWTPQDPPQCRFHILTL